MNSGQQILKTRDDSAPVILAHSDNEVVRSEVFQLAQGVKCSWAEPGTVIEQKTLRDRIEPWLTALVQSEHLALLIGSGLTHAVHDLATGEQAAGMDKVDFGQFACVIDQEVKRTADLAGRVDGNVEDQIRVANELLRGIEILAARDPSESSGESQAQTDCSPNEENIDQIEGESSVLRAHDPGDERDESVPDVPTESVSQLRSAIEALLRGFANSIVCSEKNLVTADKKTRDNAFNYLVSFLMTFTSRTGTRERLQLFTTNYDRYIEAAADVAGLRLIDRFVGALAPVFRASRLQVDLHYNPPGIRGEPRYLEGVAHFTKLHGSVDWIDCENTIRRIGLPFGAEDVSPYLAAPGLQGVDALRVMIYPNAAKDRETAEYPYVELFRDFAAAICRPNSTLVCYGYSFGDEHLNRVIEDMLTIPSAHLVVIAFDDRMGRIMNMYKRLGSNSQITLLLGNQLGNLKDLVDHYLPKPSIDRTSFRMAELLRSRWGSSEPAPTANSTDEDSMGESE